MLPAEKRFSGFLEELFRYRVALLDQRKRVRSAGEVARRRRGEVLEEGERLLFSPEPQAEVLRKLEGLQAADRPDVWRLKNEVQFLLTAVRGIYLMSLGLQRLTTGEYQSCVTRAIQEFESAAPDARFLRNIHEHLDEYFAGRGLQAADLPDPSMEGGIGYSDEGNLYHFLGGKIFVVTDMATAGAALGDAVAECVRPLAQDRDTHV